MKSRLLFFVFIVGIALNSSATIVPFDFSWLQTVSVILIYSSAFIILFNQSTFKSTPWFNASKIGVVLTLVGIIMKVLHWPYSDLVVTVGILGAVITYIAAFMSKKTRRVNDFLKATWVTITGLSVVLKIYLFQTYWIAIASLAVLTALIITLTFTRTNGG